ncbi:aldolase [Halostella sp. JP-L12]|uniref:HpcH/HpaI aldolase family protein n=1 Tax=Halostella TaxID=1843185 RepID=UPI000EF830A4|nr:MULTISPECIES: aldolase/citrate lyase family protein [Halostella]NHN47861.1 aldolase [Halostella sp. JP-L12]
MSGYLKRALADGDSPAGNWISIGHPSLSEVSTELGFDFVLVDTEHTTMSLETVENHVRAVDAADGPADAVIRVPSNDPIRIKRVLDTGAAGVMVPMVESADEAERIAEAVRYPPDGNRGIAGGRASRYGLEFQEYVENANDSVVTIAQIETRAGIQNAGEIARVDGVDALFVGPADMSAALDVFAEWEADELTDAIERVVAVAEETDTPVGTLTVDQSDISERVDQGFDFLIVGKDMSLFAAAATDAKETYESALGELSPSIPSEDD